MSHTPGPWEFSAGADYGNEGSYADVTALNGDLIIARVNNLIPAGAANGELLATAPELLNELKSLYRAYVRLLEAGHDRILSLGGDCDPVDKMESEDQNLRSAQAVIAKATA
ncbi:hypothetical protein L4P92_001751 [Pseudomonas aeruginosa]|nr:hypothetical protein [Pseudomonas aeruginosa]